MVRKYNPKGVREKYDDEQMFRAVQQVKLHGRPIRDVAEEFDMSKSCLFNYVNRYKNIDVSLEQNIFVKENWRLIIPLELEGELSAHILRCAEMYIGLTPTDIRGLAYELIVANNLGVPQKWADEKVAGKEWFNSFMKRHKKLSIRVPEATSVARISAFNPNNVAMFNGNLAKVMTKHQFPKSRIHNMDEHCCQTSHQPPKVVAQKGSKQVGATVSAERGETVTLAATISADGESLPPFFIFPRVNYVELTMLANCPEGSVGVAHPSGYMNRELFLMYLKFFVEKTECSVDNTHLLILDNHASHTAYECVKYAKENGIVLLTLPPHTSHKLQPLDRTVFGPFKKAMSKVMSTWIEKNPRKTMKIFQMAGFVNQVYKDVFSSSNIKAGFRSTGIYPLNSSVFKEADFAPSLITDRPNPDDTDEHARVDSNDDEYQDILDAPSTSKYVLPAEVRPIRTASPVKENVPKRQKGKTAILTDTPEMEEIEEQEEMKRNKKSRKNSKGPKKAALKQSDVENLNLSDSIDFIEEIPSPINEFENLEPSVQKSDHKIKKKLKRNKKIDKVDFVAAKRIKTEKMLTQKSRKDVTKTRVATNDPIPAKKMKSGGSQSRTFPIETEMDQNNPMSIKQIKFRLNDELVEERIVIKSEKTEANSSACTNSRGVNKRISQPNTRFADYIALE